MNSWLGIEAAFSEGGTFSSVGNGTSQEEYVYQGVTILKINALP